MNTFQGYKYRQYFNSWAKVESLKRPFNFLLFTPKTPLSTAEIFGPVFINNLDSCISLKHVKPITLKCMAYLEFMMTMFHSVNQMKPMFMTLLHYT